jgi:lauroyl/myristoyl acyltransferase
MLQYLAYLIAKFLAVSLPTPVKYWIALRVSDLFFLFNRRGKLTVLNNLKNVPLRKDRFQSAEDMFHNFGKYLADFLFISRLNKHNWRKWVKLVNYENFDNAYREGKGVIALTTHIGNWELGGIILALLGYPISAIVLPQRNKAVNNIFVKQRQSKGMKPISLGLNLREGFRKLKNGEVLAILGDRNIRDKSIAKSTGVEVEFFGKKAHFPKGPAVLAYWTQAIILPGFTIRGKDNKYTLYFERPVPLKRCKDKEEFIRVNTQKIATVIEKYVSLYPEQWCVFEEVW